MRPLVADFAQAFQCQLKARGGVEARRNENRASELPADFDWRGVEAHYAIPVAKPPHVRKRPTEEGAADSGK